MQHSKASVNLASNENPFGPSPKAVAAMREAAARAHLYPDNDATELRQKLAQHHAVAMEQVLVGAGSTDLIGLLARSLLRPGLNAVTSERSFIVYGMAVRDAGGDLIEAPVRHDGFDLSAIAGLINAQTRLVFLANPNNPTGTLFDRGATDDFLNNIASHVTVVLDEAYYDYAQYFATRRSVQYSHSLDYVREGRNVIMLRTFSKAHGLAGVRVGYALGDPCLLERCTKRRNTYSVSLPAQAAALAALEDQGHVRHAVEVNAVEAERLGDELLKLGYKIVPTWANFLYCDVGTDADRGARHLEGEGVLVRPLGPWGAPNAVRITIGTPEQNAELLAAIKKLNTAAAADS